ncbi:Helix-turn-helix domain protein [Roseovarius albus]|uniref:Helix-turn-helix domain protein n=1 Tax=Roseovarius albus TaxID=1247867 RepID=A0A1X6ZKX2_9RHOB|nr:helix-turn-helix transcriptional regulator [Roseovarius albus]SLN54892.1 Helix-turn-helix domain protein [Roseovarius albus]
MSSTSFQNNLRLLCSYGRSTSDVCRRAGFNRQQFNKYLNGHAQPSLATLRKICDFFGVDDHEILLPHDAFKAIVRLRPPNLGVRQTHFEAALDNLIQRSQTNHEILERHAGYYHSYYAPDPARNILIRTAVHLYKENDAWLTKTVDRKLDDVFFVPSRVKYIGVAMEAFQRITILEREVGSGRSLWASMLYCSEHAQPNYLSGLCMSVETEGRHDISCIRTVWQYLGTQPNLRDMLSKCGVVSKANENLPDIILEGTDNSRRPEELTLYPRI